jgi:glycosyltransferase involved in cell wall biosynthesis
MTELKSQIDNRKSEIVAIVLTRNEERHIGECLDALAWADRRVVIDTASTDRTCEIAREHRAEVRPLPFENFAAQRNKAMELIDAEWVLFVDADERVTPELADEIRLVVAARMEENGWWIPRKNYLFGKLTRGAGYWPDHQMRLLRRGHARYVRPASETVELDGRAGFLQNALIHYNYESIAQFHHKQRVREEFELSNLSDQFVRPKRRALITQPLRHFWWRFVTLKGYRDGLHGLRLSILLAYYFGYRYQMRLLKK